jgi:hypothetical protein
MSTVYLKDGTYTLQYSTSTVRIKLAVATRQMLQDKNK